MDNVNKLVDAIVSGNLQDANAHFKDELHVRTLDAIESQKPHVAQDMFGQLAKEVSEQ